MCPDHRTTAAKVPSAVHIPGNDGVIANDKDENRRKAVNLQKILRDRPLGILGGVVKNGEKNVRVTSAETNVSRGTFAEKQMLKAGSIGKRNLGAILRPILPEKVASGKKYILKGGSEGKTTFLRAVSAGKKMLRALPPENIFFLEKICPTPPPR